MTSFFNMLNEITDVITNAVLNGMIRLQEPMVELLVVLAIIGIASNWEMYFASESWNWGNLFVKTIHIGFYAFLNSKKNRRTTRHCCWWGNWAFITK